VRHYLGDPTLEISTDAAEALLVHDWPWNVRELEHAMVAIASSARVKGILTMELLPAPLQQPFDSRGQAHGPPPGWNALLDVRRDRTPSSEDLQRVLSHFGGNVSHVASFFGRKRRQVYRWVEQFSLNVVDARSAVVDSRSSDHPGRAGDDT
jgi:transcriptional regulator of acetoin/glycerol metabolism